MRRHPFLHSAPPAGGTPAAPPSSPAPSAPAPADPVVPTNEDWRGRRRPDVTSHARQVLAENNNDPLLATVALLQVLFDERDQRRELEIQVGRLKPKPGQLVLDGEQAEQWRQYQTLGTLDVVRTRLGRADQADQADAQAERDGRVDWAATNVEPNVPWSSGLLKRLLREDGHEVVRQKVKRPREGGGDPEEIEVPYVQKVGQQNPQPVPLADYAAQHWQGDGLLAALRTPPAEPQNGSAPQPQGRAPSAPAPTLTRFLPQGSAEGRSPAPRTDQTGDYLRNKYGPPNKPADR